MPPTAYYGAVINPQEHDRHGYRKPYSYDALPSCLLVVSVTGEIVFMERSIHEHKIKDALKQAGYEDAVVEKLQPGQFLMPGLIDTHTHAPQFPNLGIGQDYQLLGWLENVVFPMEATFEDVDFAERVYPIVVKRLIDLGTTTCCYYGSIHVEATKVLVRAVNKLGQRAFIGKCNIDREVPENNKETTEDSIEGTRELIKYIQGFHKNNLNPPLIQPVVTPRFAICCSPALLHGLSNLIKEHEPPLHIQTHLSENLDEVAKVGELFPGNKSYADVYDHFDLLGPRTILAHAVHLGDDEVKLIRHRDAGISHCPTSNFYLTSGIAPVGKYLDAGIKVGLGTDVGGGYEPSILNVIQDASIASKAIVFQSNTKALVKPGYSGRKLSVATLLYLATLGGAEVCGLEESIGSFKVGKRFDALWVQVRPDAGNPGLWPPSQDVKPEKDLRGMLERFLFCGDDRNISKVFVQGKFIGGKLHNLSPCDE